jgi:hypothetical protein
MSAARTEIRVGYNQEKDRFELYAIHPHIQGEILMKTLTPEGAEALSRDVQRVLDFREVVQTKVTHA